MVDKNALPQAAIATLQSLGWRCIESAFINSDTRQREPIFYVYDADNIQHGYGATEADAWRAAVEYARYRGWIPDDVEE